MDKQTVISEALKLALKKRQPRNQYECCLVAARISIAVGDIPQNDAEFIDAAHGQAAGLFGPAFAKADPSQKAIWIDMCEQALREAAGAPLAG